MKKYFGILTAIILVTFFLAISESDANGKNGKGNSGPKGGGQGTNFVDANGDGVCDSFIDANSDGVCDHCTGDGLGRGNRGGGQGTNFVDADGDGVCDSFIDADGDGVCDHCTGDGLGQGNGGKGQGNNNGKGGNGKRLRDGSCDLDVEQNFPNPFIGSTTINVNSSETTVAQVTLYDETGNKVAELFNGNLNSGDNAIEVLPENLKPGIYYYQVTVNGNAVTKRLMYGSY